MADVNRYESEIAALIERLERLMRTEEYDAGLNPAQWEALRFLARCNRFSNSPSALTAYLGATKGTVSQTVRSLERKGMVSRARRQGAGRSVELSLTEKGAEILARDPRRRIGPAAAALDSDTLGALRLGLRTLLQDRIARRGLKTFGLCRSCRHFLSQGAKDEPDGPHRCGLLAVPLAEVDAAKLCVEHEPASVSG